MNQVDYKKKYNEALERMKSWARGEHPECFTEARKAAEFIFPELAENEDEVIKQEIIKLVRFFYGSSLVCKHLVSEDNMIAWLEKQGEQKPVEHVELKAGHWYFCHQAFCCRADDLTVKEGERFMCEEDGVVKGFIIKFPEKYFIEINAPESQDEKQKERNGLTKDEEFTLNRIIEHFEEEGGYDKWIEVLQDIRNIPYQKEQKPAWSEVDEARLDEAILMVEANGNWVRSEDGVKLVSDWLKSLKGRVQPKPKQGKQKHKFRVGDTIKCKYDDRQFTIKSVDLDKGTYTYTQEGSGNDIDYADEEFELVEQKPVDKAEPKFKVGDWIINNDKRIAVPIQILKIEKYGYVVSDGYTSFDKVKTDYHLWTIQDANDGDILCCESGWTCIFKALDNHTNTFSSYCFMDSDKWFCDMGGECHTLDKTFIKAYSGEIYPATKEQCDLFFAKMKEAGYEWDSEKKELKAIGDWVDLGLPSGTLWKSSNETNPDRDLDVYTYDEAMQKFGNQLPTKEQCEELKNNCQWTWTGNGYNVTGPNGNSIFLLAAGYSDATVCEYYVGMLGVYWSSTSGDSEIAWYLYFGSSGVRMGINYRGICQSVRLVNSTVH